MERYLLKKKATKFEALKKGSKREWVSWRVTPFRWRSWEEKEIDLRKDIIRAEAICHLVKFTFLHAGSPYTDSSRHTIQLPSALIHRGVPWPPLHTTLWALRMLRTLSYVSLGSDSQEVHPLSRVPQFSSSPLNPWGQRPSLSPHKMSPCVSLLLINMAAAFIISLKIWSPDSIIFYSAEVSQVFHILLAY